MIKLTGLYKKNKKSPFILYITGGLGNQLFQFATAYAYAKKHKKKVYINIDNYSWARWREHLGFDLDKIISPLYILPQSKWTALFSLGKISNIVVRIYRKLFWLKGSVFVEKETFVYDKGLMNNDSWNGIKGYFQSPYYFESVKDEIISMVNFPIYSKGALAFKDKITLLESAVALHYRDYADPSTGSESTKKVHGELSLNYYKQAISIVNKRVSNPIFFIFSNNTNSAKSKFSEFCGVIFIEYHTNFNWEDMALMSICKHNIICNSSYSWWSAYLNKNTEKIVIAPKSWGNLLKGKEECNSLFPKEWILIDE
ncbi:MAG: alpha-1,2-fucosyltransferase [Bacteroidetes bacterium]|nr:alpha-1,2-fucosyltransferase [Bacteroidota bacterium]